MRINHFSDTWNVWVPFPSNTIDETFLNFVQSQDKLRPSKYSDYASEEYILTSYDIYLDEDIRHIARGFDTFLTLISDVGGISRGLTIIFSILLFQWQTYNHD